MRSITWRYKESFAQENSWTCWKRYITKYNQIHVRTCEQNTFFSCSVEKLHMEQANKCNSDYTIISADAVNKIHAGTLAVSR